MTRAKNRPRTVEQFAKKRAAFKKVLIARGSSIEKPTNPSEALRFTTPEGVGVIYQNGSGYITSWQNGADRAWDAYAGAKSWRVGERVKSPQQRKLQRTIAALKERDGDGCFYCPEPMVNGETTIEHLLSRTHGGSNHLHNLALAHDACNRRADHMSVVEKVALRETMRAEP